MSDTRIHLSFELEQTPSHLFEVELTVRLKYPNVQSIIFYEEWDNNDTIEDIKIITDKIEALVRSLAGQIKYYRICPYCKDIVSVTDNLETDYHDICFTTGKKVDWNNIKKIPFENRKLKVTFGSGTWVNTTRKECLNPRITTQLELPEEIVEKMIIAPLQHLEKVCKELGVEIDYDE